MPKKLVDDYFAGAWIGSVIKNKSSLEFLDDVLDPEKNDFKLTAIKNLNTFDIHDNELWTDSECLFMISHS